MDYTIRRAPREEERRTFKINKKLVAMLILFFLLVFAYKISGLQPITGYAVLAEVGGNASLESTVQLESADLLFTPASLVLNTKPNQSIESEATFTNHGTLSLSLALSAHGDIAEFITLPNTLTLQPNESATTTLQFHPHRSGTFTGSLKVQTPYATHAIPIELHVYFPSPTSGGSAGGFGNGPSQIAGTTQPEPRAQPAVLTLTMPKEHDLENTTCIPIDITTLDPTISNFTLEEHFEHFEFSNESCDSADSNRHYIALKTINNTPVIERNTIKISSGSHSAEATITLYANGTFMEGVALYNRSMPRSPIYEMVPVPNARVLLSELTTGQGEIRTKTDGTFRVYRAKNTELRIQGGAFLVDENAYVNLSEADTALHFFLRRGKAKVSIASVDPLYLGRTTNLTLATLIKPQDTALENFHGLSEVLVELRVIKEVDEKIYPLSETTRLTVNLSEGTHYIPTTISMYSAVPGRDLYLPQIQVKLLTATNDILSEKKMYTTIHFLEAEIHEKTITITNPTSAPLHGILLSSRLENEFRESVMLQFSENNFDLARGESEQVTVQIPETQPGHFTGVITISGTLQASGSWDEPAADVTTVPISIDVPKHDVSIYLASPPVQELGTPLRILVENNGVFEETTPVQVTVNQTQQFNQTITLAPGTSTVLLFPINTSLGLHSITLNAPLSLDSYPTDNLQETTIRYATNAKPQNAILIVLDGGGNQYINARNTPFLHALKKRSFTAENMRVRIPSTTQSHSILYASRYEPGWSWSAFSHMVSFENGTIFDSAHAANYSVLGVLGQGDAEDAVHKFDAIVHDDNNNWVDLGSVFDHTENLSPELYTIFNKANNLSAYQDRDGLVYINYNQWTVDSLQNIIQNLNASQKFILVANFPGTDHAGHDLAESGYFETYKAVDAQLEFLFQTLQSSPFAENTLFTITADHGMCFRDSTHGRLGYHSSCESDLAYNVPFILAGPSIHPKRYEAAHTNDDIAVTLEHVLGFLPRAHTTGQIIKAVAEDTSELELLTFTHTLPRVGELITFTSQIKNVGTLRAEEELCFTLSAFKECTVVHLDPSEEIMLTFQTILEASGIYAATIQSNSLAHAEFLHAGLFNDLEVSKIVPELEDGKLKAKVTLLNLGHFDLVNFSLQCIKTNLNTGQSSTQLYTKKDLESESKKTFGPWSCGNSFAGSGLYNFTFQLYNFSDQNAANNIKTSVMYVP